MRASTLSLILTVAQFSGRSMLVALPAALGGQSLAAADAPTVAPTNRPVVIQAGVEWIPLRAELDIEPGSALDFSSMGFTEAPAGRHGRVIARADGQFAFADSPDQPRRFYGVNLCFGAHYLSHSESDLFVSRPVPWREVGLDRDGQIPMDTFKILVPVHDGAFENWKAFSRVLLSHVNPYTERRYADEPALAWLAMINEGNFGNFFKDIQTVPEWKQAWNRWLARRYGSRQSLANAWVKELTENEDPARQNVALPERLQADGPRARDCIVFLADTEREMVERMKAFLHDELGCRALISNASSWTRFTTDQSARAVYDYVDDHFYVDHPQFLERPWRLPSRCPNTSPLLEGAAGGRSITFTRLFDKPFALTEYNYSAPGRFRGVGGILTGALGALQGWGGIWRFAYSHSREAMFAPARLGYFDMASDPLSQAAERASLCLFLRGDLQTAPHSVALAMTRADLARPAVKIPTLAPKWHWLAWVTRVGTQVVPSPEAAMPHLAVLPLGWQTPASAFNQKQVLALDPYSVDNDRLRTALAQRNLFAPENAPDPARNFFRSETGEITIDGPRNRLVLDTPRTAGGYAQAGDVVAASKGGVKISVIGSDATVWVSALGTKPIRQSDRLLVTHLTDLQNSDIQYAEAARQTLLDWGRLPHVVRAGKAEIAIGLGMPAKYRVWALATGGRRLAEIPATVEANTLRFTADVAGDPATGARMLYEVAVK